MTFCLINEKLCVGCGACAAVCPVSLFKMENRRPSAVDNAEKMCIKCGHCVAVCPQAALAAAGIAPQDCLETAPAPELNEKSVERFIRSRRSVRNYQAKPVELEKLLKLVDLAHYAPTACNAQQVGWLVLSERKQVELVARHVAEHMRRLHASGNPIALQMGFDRIADAFDNGHDAITRSAPALVLAHGPKGYDVGLIDGSIALATMELAARPFGLGACWAGFVMMALPYLPEVVKELGLPADREILGGLMLGYPAYQYHRCPPRNKADVKVL